MVASWAGWYKELASRKESDFRQPESAQTWAAPVYLLQESLLKETG